jgi:LuxR family maltose regulon positive regulatory protein
MLTSLCIKQANYSQALAWIERQLKAFETLGRKESLVEIYLLQAECYQSLGKLNDALESLEQALAIAEPAGYLRIFLDQGPPIQKLLERSTRTPYVNQLIALFRGAHAIQPADPQFTSGPQDLLDPLSERELEILRLLPTNLTTPEMAEGLFISVSTVRSHIKSIYSKLNVHRRTEAVNYAEALGLL